MLSSTISRCHCQHSAPVKVATPTGRLVRQIRAFKEPDQPRRHSLRERKIRQVNLLGICSSLSQLLLRPQRRRDTLAPIPASFFASKSNSYKLPLYFLQVTHVTSSNIQACYWKFLAVEPIVHQCVAAHREVSVADRHYFSTSTWFTYMLLIMILCIK
ncbi:hypothetical protein M407DRAFT_107082 [Tulasnella calospora MUT 4182]|uniref:Uncharacterized protein n=1 Tax=Tulasnella calospora MUT 4182 TaxID=1051891 RepID=A0A0C3KQV6_9AGAM|nr:hypothetical protein M407DRAFT_107082 [Tulasnella calospora MUT 4182]